LPFISMWATLSESVTRNPFDERFTGVLFGFMMVLPQFFYNRAYYLGYREALGQDATQIILDEDIADGLLDDFSADAVTGRRGLGVPPVSGGGHHLVGSSFTFEAPQENEKHGS